MIEVDGESGGEGQFGHCSVGEGIGLRAFISIRQLFKVMHKLVFQLVCGRAQGLKPEQLKKSPLSRAFLPNNLLLATSELF